MHEQPRIDRRAWLSTAAGAAAGAMGLRRIGRAADSAGPLPPVRQITRGPKHHWFGYYDKLQFDPTNRYALGMEVDFEHRSPRPDDVVRVGTVDLGDGDKWTELGTSTAWCWQQGCMLQWRPGSASEILWNDREKDAYVLRILDVKTGAKRTVPHPIYAVSPDGRWAVASDFRRLGDMRPGYGYNGIPDPNRDVLAPKDSGIWRVDLETGKSELIVSLADVAGIPFPKGDLGKAKHWFNHLLVNPDGTRFEFLHRWKVPGEKRHTTRMLTAAPGGSDIRIVDDNGVTSHFIWRDPGHILAWSLYRPPGGFFLFQDKTGAKAEPVLMTADGHCSYLPGNRWILCDTYPDRQRNQHVYLFDVHRRRRVELGAFFQPPEYWGSSPYHEWRCDTHPRASRDGKPRASTRHTIRGASCT